MIVQSARLTLLQHRFEISAGALFAITVALAALVVNARLGSTGVLADCLEAWRASAGAVGPSCDGPVREFARINGEEAGKVLAAMAILPFAVGLLGGVPLVSRELEARTAQTAWAIAPSRRRWLGYQLWPVLLVLGSVVAAAAFAASLLETTRAPLASGPLADLGLHGPLVVGRALGAFGLGILCGAIVGRTLPAFVLGMVLVAGLVATTSAARDYWIGTRPMVVVEQADVDRPNRFNGVVLEQAWRTPDGRVLKEQEATALAPTGVLDPYQWLIDSGHEVVQLGVPAASLDAWEPMETLGFAPVGLVSIAATGAVVDRRRPA